MAEKVRSFTLFEDQERLLSIMSDEQCGKLLRCLYAFNAERSVEIADPLVQMAFWQISDTIARVRAFAEAKKQAGQAGGKAKANAAQAESKQNLAEPSRQLADESAEVAEPSNQIAEPTSISVSISGSISESKKEEKEEKRGGNPPTPRRSAASNAHPAQRFVPPTVEEVAAYCASRNNGINAQHFVDYHEARGWVLKNGQKVKNWQAAVRTWEARERASPEGGHDLQARTVAEKQYLEREERAKALLAVNMQRQHHESALKGTDGGADLPPGYSLPPNWH